MFAVFPGGGQQLIKRNKHHNAGHTGKQQSKDCIAHDGTQYQPTQQSAQRLGQTRQERVSKGFGAGTGGLVDGNRYGKPCGGSCDADANDAAVDLIMSGAR